MEVSKTSFYSSNFPRARESSCSKFVENLDPKPQKDSLALI